MQGDLGGFGFFRLEKRKKFSNFQIFGLDYIKSGTLFSCLLTLFVINAMNNNVSRNS